MARLIKTEKEVEGRYEDVWIVVEEDAIEQWPEGPLEIVGRDVPRIDGADRVRGQIPYTADLQLPGLLHTAVLAAPALAAVSGRPGRLALVLGASTTASVAAACSWHDPPPVAPLAAFRLVRPLRTGTSGHRSRHVVYLPRSSSRREATHLT